MFPHSFPSKRGYLLYLRPRRTGINFTHLNLWLGWWWLWQAHLLLAPSCSRRAWDAQRCQPATAQWWHYHHTCVSGAFSQARGCFQSSLCQFPRRGCWQWEHWRGRRGGGRVLNKVDCKPGPAVDRGGSERGLDRCTAEWYETLLDLFQRLAAVVGGLQQIFYTLNPAFKRSITLQFRSFWNHGHIGFLMF